MDIVESEFVTSTAGREKGRLFFVVDVQNEYLLLADGKDADRLERPKRKRRKHAALLRSDGGRGTFRRIRSSEQITNSELRKALAVYRGEQ